MRNLFGSLLLALSLVAGFAHALAAAPVAGTNYEVLKVAHPTSAPPGKVEVISFFSYVIPQCYQLEPTLEAFVKKEGDRIVFKRVAVTFLGATLLPDSQLYYSLVSLGLGEKLMLTVYDEIQKKKNYLLTWDEQADFLATQGVDKRKFLLAQGHNVISLREQGDKLSGDYQIDNLPTLVVAGRYKIGPVSNGPDGMATVLDYLVKQVQDKKL
jgi:thiol:disulfide interchange protein DsbA